MCSAHHLAKTFFRRVQTVNWSHLNDLVLEPLPTGAWNRNVWLLWKWFGGKCWLGNALGKQIVFGNILGWVGQCSGQEADLQGNILAKVAGRHKWSTGELLLPGKLRWSICWKVQWLFQNAALIKKMPQILPRIGKVCKTHWRSLSLNPSITNIAVAWCLKFFLHKFCYFAKLANIFAVPRLNRNWCKLSIEGVFTALAVSPEACCLETSTV